MFVGEVSSHLITSYFVRIIKHSQIPLCITHINVNQIYYFNLKIILNIKLYLNQRARKK